MGLNASEEAGENEAPNPGVMPPGVQACMYWGVEPDCQGVIEGDCPDTLSNIRPGIIIPGIVVDISMAILHFSASSMRSNAPVPPLGTCPSMMHSLTPCILSTSA